MSKKIKGLLERDMAARFKDLDGIAVINPRGLEATKTNNIRRRLREQGLRMTVVKNTLAKRAAGDGKLKGFDKLLDGPSAVIYGNHAAVAVVARALLAEKKLDEKLELRGLFFDGEIYVGDKGMETASKLPTREEAIGQLVGLILSPASKLAGALKGPAGVLAGILKAVEEKAKATEAAAPAAAAPAAAPVAAPVAAAPVAAAPAAEPAPTPAT